MWSGAAGATDRERENCDGDHIADDRGLVAFNGIGTPTGGPSHEHTTCRQHPGASGVGVIRARIDDPFQLAAGSEGGCDDNQHGDINKHGDNPSDAAPGKAQAPVLPRTVTKPNVDTPATSAATGRSAGSKRDKIEATNGGDERSEESTAHKARRAQRAPDATKGADDDASTSRKRGLEKIGRMLEAMHRMRPNFFARWR